MSDTMHVSGSAQPTTSQQLRHPRLPGETVPPHSAPCVPREYVHRPLPDDVLITSWRRTDDAHFSLTAVWPHEHGYFTTPHGRHHPVLTGETIRQAGLLLCHTELGVPVGHHFILGDLVYTMDPELLAVSDRPTPLTIDVTCTKLRMRSGTLVSGRFDMTIRKAGRIVATGHSNVTVASPGVYRRLRGDQLTARRGLSPLPPAVAPHLTGSATEHDVLLSPTDRPDRWLLRVAPGHAAVVNPANDHIPGMVLLDAAQQAARAHTTPDGFVPYAVGTEFRRYAEHSAPCVIEARHVASALPCTTTVQVTGRQHDEPVFVTTLTALDARD